MYGRLCHVKQFLPHAHSFSIAERVGYSPEGIDVKLLVLGATGATGTLFTDAAIDAGHHVVALARDPQRLAPRNGLQVISGDARDAQALMRTTDGADAVISTLGVGSTRNPNGLIRDATRATIDAAARTGLRRVVWQSAFGVGDSYPKASFLMHLGYRLAPAVFRDKAAAEQLLRASDLDWTIAYPGVLTNGPHTGQAVATDLGDIDKLKGMPRISRADVADFLLTSATTTTWNKRIAVLTTGTA